MKFSMTSILALAALVNVSTANFDVYMVDEMTTIPQQADVSGTKIGVRCEADDLRDCVSQSARADAIKVLEMNFHGEDPVYHWTIYQDRNYEMIGLDGKVYGQCILFPGNSYECRDGPFGGFFGTRKFRCLTEFTAAQIKETF
ncbi:hypothetical protein NM208_g2903 [Fusarium decemcellulare]|uniref:Uncharacterized protein n=1 Tax=Fusarium decemcellulare TaxID=57161 RepID=A0ACC1SQZ8_9HYPO|nr:hypothetical protein NM208_g2903 [Fusarium decemcellulare]